MLGRNQDCAVVLNVPAVSREHAVIRQIGGKFYIEDMKSRNGTTVNDKAVTTRTLLRDNDKIKICDFVLAFHEKPPLPTDLVTLPGGEEEEEDSSSIEATLTGGSSKQVLETQPAEKLALLIELGADLSQTCETDQLLPKIVTTGVCASIKARRLGSSSARLDR